MNNCVEVLVIAGVFLTTIPRLYAMVFHPSLTQSQVLRDYWICWLPGTILLIMVLGIQIFFEDINYVK